MSKKYFKQTVPFIVPTNDGKLIEEHFGGASTQQNDVSIARMIAPPGWSEPAQIPEFRIGRQFVTGMKFQTLTSVTAYNRRLAFQFKQPIFRP